MGRESSEMTAECFRFIWKSPRFEFVASVSHPVEDSLPVLDLPQLAEQLARLVTSRTHEEPTGIEWSWAPFQAPSVFIDKWIKPLENAVTENSPHPSNSNQSPPADSDTHLE